MGDIEKVLEDELATFPDIKSDISDFTSAIKAISRSQPLAMSSLEMTHMVLYKKHFEFLNSHCEITEVSDDTVSAKIPYDQMHRWSREKDELHSLKRALELLPPTYVVALVSQLDFFLGKLLRWIFWVKPEMLNSSERTLTLAQLTEYSSIEAAREVFIEKEVETFLRKSHVEQFKWLEERLGIPLRKDLPSWPHYVELTERRNLFVHANGRVSRHYLLMLESVGLSANDVVIGSELVADRAYFSSAYSCVFEVAFKLAQVIWRKLDPNGVEAADNNFMEVQYKLLLSREFRLAALLGQFYRKYIKRPSSDECRRIILINEGIALCRIDEDRKCSDLLTGEDWSSCSLKFKLAVEVLTGTIEKVLRYMDDIGERGDVDRQDYASWPLFAGLRKDERFLKKYEEIFGEELEVSEAFKTIQKPAENGSADDLVRGFEDLIEDMRKKGRVDLGDDTH